MVKGFDVGVQAVEVEVWWNPGMLKRKRCFQNSSNACRSLRVTNDSFAAANKERLKRIVDSSIWE